MIRRPPRSTQSRSSAASDVYKRQIPYIVKKEWTIYYRSIRVTLGFSKTIHKSQSLTEDMVSLDVNQRPAGIVPLTLKAFFVAYTRVRSNEDLRVLPPVNGDLRFSHLTKLRHDPILIHWLAGFKEGEVWDVEAARDHYNRFACAVPKKKPCLLYTSPSPRDGLLSRMPSSA